MEMFFLTIESFLYFTNIQMVMSKIIGCKNKNYIVFSLILLSYSLLVFTAIFASIIFIFVYMAVQFLQIFLIRLINKKSEIKNILCIYLFLYCATLLATALLECAFLLSNYQSFIV